MAWLEDHAGTTVLDTKVWFRKLGMPTDKDVASILADMRQAIENYLKSLDDDLQLSGVAADGREGVVRYPRRGPGSANRNP